MEYQDLRNEVLNQIKPVVPQLSFNTFFRNSFIEKIKEGSEAFVATIVVPHGLARDRFEQHAGDIVDALTDILGAPVQMDLKLKPKDDELPSPSPAASSGTNTHLTSPPVSHNPSQPMSLTSSSTPTTIMNSRSSAAKPLSDDSSSPLFSNATQTVVQQSKNEYAYKMAIKKSGLNPDHTFENFAVSPTNEVAFAGATAVAKNPGYTYNPFFIYGDVGVGKTHLMHAVGIRILEDKSSSNLVYCIGEQFTNEIIEAIQTKKTPQFRNKYRKVDVLLIDDIQFIAGKDFVQEEFFHTFNSIKSAGGQVVMTADKPPHEIKLLEDRLRSRFEEGLAIDIQEPNFELRTAILRIKAQQMGMNLPMEGAQMIAQHTTSTRKLEGILKKIYASVSLNNNPITEKLVSEILKSQGGEDIPEEKRPYIRPAEIVKEVARHYNISEQLIYGTRRSKPIVIPRQYAMYLIRMDLNLPFQEIGRIFGGRDHSTVMHAVQKISAEVSKSNIMQQEFSTLRKQIYG